MPLEMELPEWHQTSYAPAEVVNLRTIAEMDGTPNYAALRSYAVGRREHRILGPMPAPVARIANRRLWLVADINEWLTIPIPAWKRSRRAMKDWIEAGRPRVLEPADEETADAVPAPESDAATMPADDGYGTRAT